MNIKGKITALVFFTITINIFQIAYADGDIVTTASSIPLNNVSLVPDIHSHDIYLNEKHSFNQNRQKITQIEYEAENGDFDAQHALGTIYLKGFGVTKSDVVALMWYTISSENGLKKAKKDKSFTENYMAFDQIKLARRMATLWQANH